MMNRTTRIQLGNKSRIQDATSLKTKAYSYIRHKLLSQEWTSGYAISHREIAAAIDIGFTPVREAINQLVTEGFLECHPQRGTFVTRVSREDLAELYDVREALECHALRKIVDLGHCDTSILRECNRAFADILAKALKEEPPEKLDRLRSEWSNVDVKFHKTLLILSGNRLAIGILQELRDKTRIFGHRSSLAARDLEIILQDHEKITSAIESDDAQKACQEMQQHLRRGCEIALSSYDRNRLLAAAE